jgi:ribonuclease D
MNYRSRSHQAAHLDDAPQDEVPEMELVHRGEPAIAASAGDLASLLDVLRADGVFAYDTEFIGEMTYFPKLCLVQVASRSTLALIDPLAVDMKPFWELVADPSVTKIVHAAESDIEPVVRTLGKTPANVFDTQIGAGFIGLPYPMSLKKLVLELTGAGLGKDAGFTDWQQRPLTAMQVRYAADDVRYLPAAHREMMTRLEALGRTRWVEEECAAACDPKRFGFDAETQYTRVRGVRTLQPRSQAVLRELAIWRDAAARRADKPPRSFLKDEVLIDLAKAHPASPSELSKVHSLARRIAEEHGVAMLAAIARGWSLPREQQPIPEAEPGAAEKHRHDAVLAAFQCLCVGMHLDPGLVASRRDVERLYEHVESGSGETPELLRGWRAQAAGEALCAFLRGERAIGMTWEDGALRASTTTRG